MSGGRIAAAFGRLRERGEKGLIPFVTAGYPNLEATRSLVLAMAESGADLIELGVPFSDPLADGPVIQRASQAALGAGTSLAGILALVRELRRETDVPLVLMSYFNPIFSFGPGPLMSAAALAGADGLIIPDLPLEEAGPVLERADECGLDLIPLVAPTSTPRRIAAIAGQARGFVYCVSVTGVTGTQAGYSEKLVGVCRTVREHTGLPIAVGFGIARDAQVRALAPHVDALIVGSAIVDLIDGADENGSVKRVCSLVLELKQALQKI
ncbi:tryptophan synthase subunit alpha [Candidatus Desulforudis audaxviator]|uniref:Tryptophan synthase alpha chain n=1 Tax=Desulforudis audaxviator (strain MP104C) TaxID=477974 RepID=B1I3Z4_DESAP|nr:tryptophan synthase subunit alpha [Candidatus Desulforudis audaxviator]ACA59696.1 tryptophan synthase, alpha subunit [Candidatus Desulforudis audaxviator MP104C]AZK59689.1 Tryptophan synthase alpha chain [Candidatus Desulforudis audaxviator]